MKIIRIINILIASIILTYYIWFQFIRERLPRDIPFDLSLIGFFILLSIIIVFMLIIKREIKPINSNYKGFLLKILSILFQPFYTLNNFLQHNNYFRFACIKIFKLFFKYLFSTVNYTKNTADIRVLIFIWTFIPRILLLMIFYVDIFYFHQLYFIYVFAIISFMPLLYKYFIYLMKKYEEEFITFLENWYEIEEINTNELPLDGENYTTIRAFVDMQSFNLYFSSTSLLYKCSLKYNLIQKYYPHIKNWADLNQQQINFLEKDFHDLIPLIIKMNYFFFAYTIDIKDIIQDTKKLNILLYSLYLIGWLYILIISLPTFHLLPFEEILLKSFQDNFEPFSNLLLKIEK